MQVSLASSRAGLLCDGPGLQPGEISAPIHPTVVVFCALFALCRTCYEDNILATGFGGHLALPILRKKWRPDLEEGEAR